METKLARKLSNLDDALSIFSNALNLELTSFQELVADNIKSGQIQKFEFTIELLWKTIQAFLYEVDGVDVATPKSVAKEFVKAGYCDYPMYELFIQAINDRNQLSHIYRQEMAESIWSRLPEYENLAKNFATIMREKYFGKELKSSTSLHSTADSPASLNLSSVPSPLARQVLNVCRQPSG